MCCCLGGRLWARKKLKIGEGGMDGWMEEWKDGNDPGERAGNTIRALPLPGKEARPGMYLLVRGFACK